MKTQDERIVRWIVENMDRVAEAPYLKEQGVFVGSPRVVRSRAVGRSLASAGFVPLALAYKGAGVPAWVNFWPFAKLPLASVIFRRIALCRQVLGVDQEGQRTPAGIRAVNRAGLVSSRPYDALPGVLEIFVVASPDDSYRDELLDQGIRFLQVPEEVVA